VRILRRHCEQRSDDAIRLVVRHRQDGLRRFTRNDGSPQNIAAHSASVPLFLLTARQ
jgi:hypothetical protein